MTKLAEWLQNQMQTRGLRQAQPAVYAGLARATIGDTLRRRLPIPRPEPTGIYNHLTDREWEGHEEFRQLPLYRIIGGEPDD